MNNQENDKDSNSVSNQDMREYKSADRGVEDSGGLTEADAEPDETEEDSSNTENQTNNL